jgi:hypothetical protein
VRAQFLYFVRRAQLPESFPKKPSGVAAMETNATADRLDARARRDLGVERDRHTSAVTALDVQDANGLIAECRLHTHNVELIMKAFVGRQRQASN